MIDQIGGSENTVTPIDKRKIGLEMQGTSNIEDILVFMLNNRVLLWSVKTRMERNDSFFIKEGREG